MYKRQLENHVDFVEEDEKGARKNYNDLANGIIRKFCSKEVGWLEEEHDDATYEKYIIMTEQGILPVSYTHLSTHTGKIKLT